MAIEVRKRPFYYCFTGNPVHYELYSAQALADPTNSFEVRVIYKGVATESFPYSPVNGIAEIDIQDILEGLVNFELPNFNVGGAAYWTAPEQSGEFYLQYREITNANANPTWDDSEIDFKSMAIKGGISRFKYQGNNFFTNYFDADTPRVPRPFLTWQKSGRKASISEQMYLAYLLIDDVPINKFQAFAKATFTDGTTELKNLSLVPLKNQIYYLPAGATQWGFSTAKDLWYWEIVVKDTTGSATALSQTFRYNCDNRHDDNNLVLHYRNSIGGLDSVKVRGVIKLDLEYDYQELQKIQRPDYFDQHYYQPQKAISNNKELQTYRGDIGHLSKEEQDRLRDAFLKREVWRYVGSKLVPVNIITKSTTQRTTDDTRFKFPIDFTLAHEGDSFYTPDNVDLGDGTFTSNVCRASLGNVLVLVPAGPGSPKSVTVKFIELDPDNASTQFQYRVIKQSDGSTVINWTTVNYVSPLIFDVPGGEDYYFEARALCNNAIVGKKTTAEIKTTVGVGGGGGTPNGDINNNSNTGTPFELKVNGAPVSSGYVGANGTNTYIMGPVANATIVLILPFYSPSHVELYGATLYNGVITGNTITFSNVTIGLNSVIEIY